MSEPTNIHQNPSDEIITVDLGLHFPVWKLTLSMMACIITVLLLAIVSFEYFTNVHDSILPSEHYDLFVYIMCVLIAVSFGVAYVLFSSRKIFAFNVSNKQKFDGYTLLGNLKGQWSTLSSQTIRVAFQRYNQSQVFNFMGISKNEVEEEVFSLRLIKSERSYETLAETSELKELANVIKIGKAVAAALGVPFCDYVKSTVVRKDNLYVC